MINDWYYIKDGNKHGPTLKTELNLMALSGALLPNDLVWSSGMAGWVPAHSIKSLFNKEPSATSESPGPPPLPPPLPFSQINNGKETFKHIIDKSQFVWNGLNSKLIMKIFATRLLQARYNTKSTAQKYLTPRILGLFASLFFEGISLANSFYLSDLVS